MENFDSFMQKRLSASTAFVNGDVEPLKQISTATSPATLFGPKGNCVQDAEQVNKVNAEGAAHFLAASKNELEVMHQSADGHLAYWTGIQRSVIKMKGEDKEVPIDLRVTEIFRLEDGGWKLIHRHADKLEN